VQERLEHHLLLAVVEAALEEENLKYQNLVDLHQLLKEPHRQAGQKEALEHHQHKEPL
jgi:hypothetical protein